MLLIHYVDGLSSTPWLGPEPAARFGVAHVGLGALVGTFETQLGLPGRETSGVLRMAALATRVRQVNGFWSKSAEVDPFGVARRLLALRDGLMMAGWNGEPVAPRISELVQVCDGAHPGLADRLARATRELEQTNLEPMEIILHDAETSFPRRVQALFAALRKGGAVVRAHSRNFNHAGGDLGAAQRGRGEIRGDGSLELVRPTGMLAAADEIAAFLAAQTTLRSTVVIGGDAVLDAALHRYGLPRLGGTVHPEDAPLAILPLVLAMARPLPDPQRALELMSLSIGPVPGAIRGRLAGALRDRPAVGSEPWKEAIESGLGSIDDIGRRDRIRVRLATLFTPLGGSSGVPRRALVERIEWLEGWLGQRARIAQEGANAFVRSLDQCAVLRGLLDSLPDATVPWILLDRLLEETLSSASPRPPVDAEAGLAGVAGPEALLDSASTVIWWGFTAAAVDSLPRWPLSNDELAALAKIGVHPPDVGVLAGARSTRWRRAVESATGRVLFVAPRRDVAGEETHPHPLWDELAGTLGPSADFGKIVRVRPSAKESPKTTIPKRLPKPSPTRLFRAPEGRIELREAESPSSLGTLLGCSFKWTLEHAAKIRAGRSAPLANEAAVQGSLFHDVLESLLREDAFPKPKRAGDVAVARLEELGPRWDATLFASGRESELEHARQTIRRAAEALVRLVADAGLEPVAIEEERIAPTAFGKLKGTPDIVLGPQRVVIDLKRGGAKNRRDELGAGRSYQLASYAFLNREEWKFPGVGYFIVQNASLITTADRVFDGAEVIGGPTPDEVWRSFEKSVVKARDSLAAGKVEAPGAIELDEDTPEEDGPMWLEPPCSYCDYAGLCGRTWGGT